jgi:hypothetical protein
LCDGRCDACDAVIAWEHPDTVAEAFIVDGSSFSDSNQVQHT